MMPPMSAMHWTGVWLRGACMLAVLAVVARQAVVASPEAIETPGIPGAGADPMADDFTGMDLDQLMKVKVPTVYGASKHEQKITEAPSAVTIVTTDEIKKNGYRTLKDILQNVRGFYVTHDRIYSYIGVRGVNRPGDFGGRILITVDGHRMNDPIYDSALSGTEAFLDVDLIDRVEVIRGPGSSLYGNNAFFAVINIITRNGSSLNAGEISGSAASQDTYTGRFTFGHQFTNGVEFIASGTIRESVGEKRLRYPEWSSINNGVAENLDHDESKRFFTSASYHGLSLSGGYSERTKENPSAAYSVVFNERPAVVYDQSAFAELKYIRDFADDWKVMGRVFFDHYHFRGDYLYDYGGVGNPADYVANRDLSVAQSWGGEVQVTKTISEKHRITAGGEFGDSVRLKLKNFDVADGTTYLDTRESADNFGLYSQGEFTLAPSLVFNAGVRYDNLKNFGDTVNPRAGLIYSPWKETSFKALYGQAFRAPNVYEFGYLSPTYDANPSLRPEVIRSYELVWEQGFASHYRFTASGFYNQIEDMITRQVTPANHFIFRNADSADVWGSEMELEAQWPGGWRGRISYTFSHATDNETGMRLSNSPRHLGKASLSAPLYRDRIFASLEVQAMSDRLTVRNQTVDGFAVCNLTLFSRELVKGVEASASLYNLLDTRYSDPVSVDFRQRSIEQDGRSFLVKLTYRF